MKTLKEVIDQELVAFDEMFPQQWRKCLTCNGSGEGMDSSTSEYTPACNKCGGRGEVANATAIRHNDSLKSFLTSSIRRAVEEQMRVCVPSDRPHVADEDKEWEIHYDGYRECRTAILKAHEQFIGEKV